MSNESIINVPKPSSVLLVPLHRRPQSLLPIHLFLPSKLMQLITIDGVPQIIELPIWNESNEIVHPILIPKDLDQRFRHIQIADLIVPPNIVNHARRSLVKNHFERTGHVFHVQEVARVAPIPMQRHGTTAQDLVGELRNQLLGELMRSVDVVATGDDARKLEGPMVGFDQELGSGFGGGIGVGGFEDVFFVHGFRLEGLSLAVHLVRRDVDEPLDAPVAFGRFEEDVRSENIALSEVEGVSEGIVHVSLSGEMHDGVDAFFDHDVGDEVGAGDVAFDEFEVFEAGDFLEVGEARARVEFIVDDYVVVGVLFREEDGHMRPDKSLSHYEGKWHGKRRQRWLFV